MSRNGEEMQQFCRDFFHGGYDHMIISNCTHLFGLICRYFRKKHLLKPIQEYVWIYYDILVTMHITALLGFAFELNQYLHHGATLIS